MLARTLSTGVIIFLLAWQHAKSAPISTEETDFFETRIRPVLAQDCYECHRSEGKRQGGLALDHRKALLEGGDTGPALVPGDAAGSLLIQVIRHEHEDLKMPKAGAKFEDSTIADFEKWVAMGAPDPRDAPPTPEAEEEDTNWDAVMERRKSWWSFQPLREAEIPGTTGHTVDRFIQAKLTENGLQPASQANGETLIRRLSYALRGLPPTLAEIKAFVSNPSPTAYEALADSFLDSPRFGERWARHWMDWVRYTDSHGSEGDPAIPYAWRYRDYLIRALNGNVPYNQLVKEHLAGDLIANPRTNSDLRLNESAIGPAHLRMVNHGFAPTDALDEQVRFTDDQINVVSKAFLGLTVSCARCHNHKFDPISQRDFYAWYGIFASCPPASIIADTPDSESVQASRKELGTLKPKLKATLIAEWNRLLPVSVAGVLENKKAIEGANKPSSLLHPVWAKLKGEREFKEALKSWKAVPIEGEIAKGWSFTSEADLQSWLVDGKEMTPRSRAGDFAIAADGDRVLTGIYPSGTYSHLTSSKDRGVLMSPRFLLDKDYDLWMQVAGDGGAVARYSIQNYPRDGTVFPVKRLNGGQWRWERLNMDYWKGDHMHLEITTAADQAVLANTKAPRSWLGVRQVALVEKGKTLPRDDYAFARPLVQEIEKSNNGLKSAYRRALEACLDAWESGVLSDDQALLLDQALQVGLLPNAIDDLPGVTSLLARYRERESALPVPTRVPGVVEKDPYDQPLFERGNHKMPGEPVPRHFLDAIDGSPYNSTHSGRLDLAEDMLRKDNPLTRRVIVNRIWHHVFGEGLVRTPDNFGRLGQKPSHPELLDHLALWFEAEGYSIKSLIKHLVTSETWKASSEPSETAEDQDPDNILLSHAHLRRLDAEAIRDSLLAVSGRLEIDEMYGPAVNGDSARRSVYLRVKRNNLDPFLAIFDAPVPASSKGRRDVTNVPGQSLTMLNDPFVIRTAEHWADKNLTGEDKIDTLFLQTLGRSASESEASQAWAYLNQSIQSRRSIDELNERLRATETQISGRLSSLDKTITERVLTKQGIKEKSSESKIQPLAYWSFDNDLQDQLGSLHGKAHGGARIEGGALVLDGKGSFVSTAPLETHLREKTLEAWVRLDGLQQQGGGVISVQDLSGATFDAIVFAEQEKRHWMSGSNGFTRTQSFQGQPEKEAKERFVHVAMVYASDGTVTGYREGKLYGKPYKSDGPFHFRSGDAQVLFGNRHGEPDGQHLLKGRIDRAALHARALSAEEIAATASDNPNFITEADRQAVLTEAERLSETKWRGELDSVQKQLAAMKADLVAPSGWADLAHAMFNLKEFLYIR
ncbi:MAG: hypothetical protein ACI957_001669 [Verrucomicrobiales bacterium]|jgi:hypothetical protein